MSNGPSPLGPVALTVALQSIDIDYKEVLGSSHGPYSALYDNGLNEGTRFFLIIIAQKKC